VQRALEDARCEDLGDEQFASLSEGQKGRARIARALASGPNVLVLDEPTSAVDSVTEQAVFDMLDALRRARGVTILVVSHRSHIFVGRATHALYLDRVEGTAVAGVFDEVVRAPAFLSRHGPVTPPGDPLSDVTPRSSG
jgi:ABC-type Mn2+/Zn2+ transport system ATPase subunit